MNALSALVSEKSADLLADDSIAKSGFAQTPQVGAPLPLAPSPSASPGGEVSVLPTPPPNADETARGVVMATTHACPPIQQKALEVLAGANQSRVEEVISSLPPELKPAVATRVYVHVADPRDVNSQNIEITPPKLCPLPCGREYFGPWPFRHLKKKADDLDKLIKKHRGREKPFQGSCTIGFALLRIAAPGTFIRSSTHTCPLCVMLRRYNPRITFLLEDALLECFFVRSGPSHLTLASIVIWRD
jgi:hypothetical protein